MKNTSKSIRYWIYFLLPLSYENECFALVQVPALYYSSWNYSHIAWRRTLRRVNAPTRVSYGYRLQRTPSDLEPHYRYTMYTLVPPPISRQDTKQSALCSKNPRPHPALNSLQVKVKNTSGTNQLIPVASLEKSI